MNYRRRLDRNSSSRIEQASAQYFQDHQPSDDYAKGSTGTGGGAGDAASSGSTMDAPGGTSSQLPDDSKISQILRQLKRMVSNKQDVNSTNEQFEKLRQRIWDPANKGYINRSFDTIADDVVCLLLESPRRMQAQVVHTFACIGYVLQASSFPKYFGFIVKCYRGGVEKEIRLPLMESLRETVVQMNCKLKSDVAGKVIRQLKEIMENVDLDGFLCISDILDALGQAHPSAFKRYFKDVVDIIIGWHLEVDRSGELKLHCGRVLQNLGAQWTRELDFTQDLVVQVKEDIEASEADSTSKTQFGCYLGAFNTIVKCLSLSGEFCLEPALLGECFQAVLASIGRIFQVTDFYKGYDIISNANEFLLLLMKSGMHEDPEYFHETMFQLVMHQMDLIPLLTDDQISSVIHTVTKIIPLIVTKQPEVIQGLFSGSPSILEKRFTKSGKLRLLLIEMYQQVLCLKNMQLLKHVYTDIVQDLEVAVQCLGKRSSVYTAEQTQLVIIFNLGCLTRLAMDNTSIIALYACQPSLLEVFVNVLQPQSDSLWSGSPEVHEVLVNITYLHCRQNKNFVMSSNLLKGTKKSMADYSKESPTCEHFEIILELLATLSDVPLTALNDGIVLDWSYDLVANAKGNDQFYSADPNWLKNCRRMIGKAAVAVAPDVVIKAGQYLEQVVQLPTLAEVYSEDIASVCCQRIGGTNATISQIYLRILGALPLNVALNKSLAYCSEPSQVDACWRSMVNGNRSESDIWPCHFAELFKALAIEPLKKEAKKPLEETIWECFNKCRLAADVQFMQLAMSNSSLLVGWMQWELAKFCVNNKLKTPLGKAQDTFLHIEGLIRKIARVVDGKEQMPIQASDELLELQVRSRVIMGFVEALEKCIYNAAEGTAYSYPVLEKPIKAFFKLNALTCSEWFKRNRIPIEVVAAEMMDSDMVVRNAEANLRHFRNGEASEEQRPAMEQNLVALVKAYLRLGDSHSILGLFEWTNRKLPWIQTASVQARNRFEVAGQSYKVLLVTDDLSKLVKDFVAEQMILCFCATENYEELTPYNQMSEYKGLFKKYVPTLHRAPFGMNIPQQLPEQVSNCLSDWRPISSANSDLLSFSMQSTVRDLEANLIVGSRSLSPDDSVQSSLNVLIKEAFRTRSEELLPDLLIMQHLRGRFAELQKGRSTEIASLTIDKCFGTKYLNLVKAGAQAFGLENNCSSALQLDLISVARKEKNYQLAGSQLAQYFSARLCPDVYLEWDSVSRLLTEDDFPQTLWQEAGMARASFEAAKVLDCGPDVESRDKAVKLLSHTSLIMARDEQHHSPTKNQLRAKMLLKIADGISVKEDDLLGRNKKGPLAELLQSLPEFTSIAHFNSDSVVPLSEISIGKILSHTVKLCPELSKSWCIYGNWCYKWGRKIIELSYSRKHKSSLQYDYTTELKKIVSPLKGPEIQSIINLLDDLLMADNDTDDIGPNDSDAEKLAVGALKTLPCLSKVATERVVQVIGVWHKAHRHIYGCYEMAANAYFKFLQMDNAEEEHMHQHTVMITLRLLRLIVKHALSLQDVLDGGLAATPTGPWKAIIPQLFSRLNHHELFVRKRVSELLCRVARDAPHIIIFPAVVGCGQGKAGDVSNVLVSAQPEKVDGVAENRELLLCFQALVSTLSKQAADTVAQVQMLVRELQRIGLLWDELWLVALTRVYADFNKKMQLVEQQAAAKGESSAKDKQMAGETVTRFRANLLGTIEKLEAITGGMADTKNEVIFQSKYKKHIDALKGATTGTHSDKAPLKVWNQFKSFYGILHQRANRRSASSLRMEDISPVLYNLNETVISMPGVNSEGQKIYIRSVTNCVQILPTKTRPKKLAFIGDDNRQYNYLFKGLEDLHLDERIMQFLSISNTIMRKASQKIAYGYDYRARHYSVIPLGTQSGLINWVDGVVPIFSLYKKWQQRELAKAKKATDVKDAAVMRPSELFYSKITPLLAEHKIDASDNRRTWPVHVLRQALDELAKETPNDLLAKEFWCNSTTAAGWRKTVNNYSLSVAVMSVIGYVIGLGDRHLDNVLIDVSTGEILHIDYNVCFEKGKTLRVPEKIPFRMTQNFEEALGLTGIEGTFRLTCETVLKSLKRGRETLLTLLEAFVYDPLVDWTLNQEDHAEAAATTKPTKREGKVQTMATKDSSAGGGLKQQWKTSRDEIQKSNYALEECQRSMAGKMQKKQQIATDLRALHQQLTMISSCTVDQCQILAMKYDTYHALKAAVQSKWDWSERVVAGYDDYFSRFEDSKLAQFVERSQKTCADAVVFEFESIQPIFVAANHLELLAKSRELSQEMTTSVVNVGQTLQRVYELLLQYKGDILGHLPKANRGNHFLCEFRVWCEGLIGGFNAFDLCVAQCQLLLTDISYGGVVGSSVNSVAAQTYAHNLLSAIQDLSMQRQMLGFDSATMQEVLQRHRSATERIQGEEAESGRILRLNYSVLWELHRKYKTLATTPDWSKLSYEMYLNAALFLNHANVMAEVKVPQADDNLLFRQGFDSLEKCTNLFAWLNDIKVDFSLEIVPWSIQGIFTGDPSVVEMITKISECYPHGELKELEQCLKSASEVEGGGQGHAASALCQGVNDIKYKLAELYKSYANEKHVGAQIYKRFYDMFNTLDQRFNHLIEGLSVQAPSQEETGSAGSPSSPEKTRPTPPAIIKSRNVWEVVRQLYLVKKLDALIEFFVIVMNNLRAFQGASSDATVYNDQLLFAPFKIYLNDFLYSVLFSLGEYCQSLILHGAMERMSDAGERGSVPEFASRCEREAMAGSACGESGINISLLQDMTHYWEQSYKMGYIQKLQLGQDKEIHRLHTMLRVHEWLNEDLYQGHSIHMEGGLTRSSFLLQLRPLLQQLHGWNATIVKMRQELGVLGEQIKHDLQWADAMFKPLISSYENLSGAKEKALNGIQDCCQSTMEIVELVVNYEALRRSGSESYELSNQLMELLEQIMIMCSQGVGLQPMEARIVEMGPPVGGHVEVTGDWKNAIVQKLHAAIDQLRVGDEEVEEELRMIEGTVRQETVQVLKFIPGLQSILVQVQTLTNPSGEKNCILSKYTRCMDVVCSGLHEIGRGQQMDRMQVIETVRNFNEIIACLKKTMVELKLDDEFEVGRFRSKGGAGAEVQPKQNSFAVTVWRRVRMKLEGRDPDPSKRMSVEDQVDWMIKEATNRDNLAVLYEGWTPWV